MKVKYLSAITGCALSFAIFSSYAANAVFVVKNENPVGSQFEDRVGVLMPQDGNAFMPYGGPSVGQFNDEPKNDSTTIYAPSASPASTGKYSTIEGLFNASMLVFYVINEDAVLKGGKPVFCVFDYTNFYTPDGKYDLFADDNADRGIVGTAVGDCPVPLPDNTPITNASNKYFTVRKSQNAQGLPVYTIGLTAPAR